MSATYSADMPGARMDIVYQLPGVTAARAAEWYTLGARLVRAQLL